MESEVQEGEVLSDRSGRARRSLGYLMRLAASKRGRLAFAVGSTLAGLVLVGLALRQIGNAPLPFSHGKPTLLVSVGLLFLVAFLLKACGWGRLFTHHERPGPLSLAAAGGGASVMGIVLPGRFDELIRIAIVRRFPGCPAGIRSICLSLVTLGLLDNAALAPFALVASAWPGNSLAVRLGFAIVGVGGIAAAAVVVALPRVAASKRLMRFRLARWLAPRATPLRSATEAWALISASWLVRGTALTLLLAALGFGFNFPLAMMFLCAAAAAAALPIAPAGAATQVGAGTALLVVSGIGASEAVGFALAAQTLLIISGAGALFLAVAWKLSHWLFRAAPRFV
jgi:uncharacterized membrane protein YbhN (UPF0104 family)